MATITVTSLADNMDVDGQVTLREAIEAANTDTSVDGSVAGDSGAFGGLPDEVVFQPGLTGTIDLNGTELTVTNAGLKIIGPGRDLLTIDAHHNSRHFRVTSVRFSLDGVTLTGGQAAANGGAILSDSGGSLTVRNSEIRDNSGMNGGGIYWVWGGIGSSFVVQNSTIRDNSAVDGGGIYVDGSFMQLTASTVAENQASGSGGGIHGGVISIDSTISGNTAAVSGGGIQTTGVLGHVNLQNSTVSGNVAGSTGGGVGVDSGFVGYVRAYWSTIVGNQVTAADGRGGGIFLVPSASFPTGDFASLTLQSSIIAQNSAAEGPDLKVPEILNGVSNTLIGNNAGTFLAAAPVGSPTFNGNLIGEAGALIDPMVAPLANNGGPTETHALLPDSPAIDASYDPIYANLVGVPAGDQRGFPRLENNLDIGAFELTQPLKFFDDGTTALWANNPLGFVEPPVPVFHNGAAVGAEPYQAIELYQLVPGTASYPLVFVDLVGNTFSRLAYMRSDGVAVNFGTSTVGSASFRTTDQVLHYVPTVTRADVTTGGANPYQSVVAANFGELANVTSTKLFLTPMVGRSTSTIAVEFETQQDIRLATGTGFTNNDRLRLFTASSMFNDETHFDTNVLRYEDSDGNIQTLVLKDLTPTNAYLFPSVVEIGSWFELVKTDGSVWYPDSPTIRVTIDDKHGLRLGLQGYLQQSVDNNDDSLSVWLEWLDAPDTVAAGTKLNLDVTVTATAPGTPGVLVNETDGDTVVSEDGTTDTFVVAVAAQPRSNVVIDVSSGNTGEATVSPATLTFTPANWDQPQSVTVTGVPDSQIDGDQSSTTTLQINQGMSDIDYRSVPNYTILVTTTNIDQPESPTITWNAPDDITYGTLLDDTQLNATASVPGTFVYSPASGALLNAGLAQQLSVTFTPDDSIHFQQVTAFVSVNVQKADPAITWSDPAEITFGTALGATQLDAAASVPGTFVYTPVSGTLLDTGDAQSIAVVFTPNDTANYNTATASVMIDVEKADPEITWNAPAEITYGTLLDDSQLNAIANVPGTFAYSPASGERLNAGANQSLSVSFTPTDTHNYNEITANVTIDVQKADPVITWENPTDIVFGSLLGDAELSAAADIAGVFTYTPASGTRLGAGPDQQLSVSFVPTDTANFNSVTVGVSINVTKAIPDIHWSNPADIAFGTLLSDTQLNATTGIDGSIVYSPAAGTMLNAGADQSLQVTFTPTDTVNFQSVTKSVTINVAKAESFITWDVPADITFGTLLGSTQLNAMGDQPGSYVYTPPLGTQLGVGNSQQLSVTFTPDNADFASVTTVRLINVLASNLDFGDAPSAYPVTLAQDGARHATGSLFLGSSVDAEPEGQPTSDASGDGTDEDGVLFVASLVATSGSITRSSFAVTSSGAGKLDAWIDFTQDGDWNDAGEQIFTSQDVAAGVNMLSMSVPAGAMSGDTAARFRLSSAGGLDATGAAADGEVEDYIVAVLDGDAAGGAAVEIHPPVSGTLGVVADGQNVVVRSGAIELFRAPGAKLNSLDVAGTDGDDTLNLANLDAIFAGLVGGDAGGGNDTLRLTGSGQTLDLTQIPDSNIQGLEEIDITGDGDNTLTLAVDEVINLSSTTDTLRVVHNDGDAVNYKTGWTVELPQIIAGQFVHVLKQAGATIEVDNTLPFRNPLRSLDTNRDGTVAPLDALIIINRLNTSASGSLPTPTSVAGLTEYFYIDINGDGSVAPIDVIQVINFLNNPTGSPEGESATSNVVDPVVTLLRNVNSRPPTSNPQRPEAQKYEEVSAKVPAVREFALRSNATTTSSLDRAPVRTKTNTNAAADEDLVRAIDAFFAELQAS